MTKTVSQMTVGELRDLVRSAVEDKIVELLGDPDEGLQLRDAVRRRLSRQKLAVAKGER